MSKPMVEITLPYLVRDIDRYKKIRWYVRVRGRKIPIHGEPGSDAFLEAYRAALAQLKGDARPIEAPARIGEGTLAWLGRLYMNSVEFKRLDARSQKNRRSVLESCFAEPKKPGDKTPIGACPIRLISAVQIKMLRDRRADQPGAAINRLKYLSAMFGWAIEDGKIDRNPVRDVKSLRYATDGFHAWDEQEIEQFEAFWPRGTKPRLAMAILLYVGLRESDAVLLGRQHRRGDEHVFVPQKPQHVKMEAVHIPILPILEEELAAGPAGDLTYLMTEYGKPFSAKGFSQWFSEQCTKAGLPNCTAHGLRKGGANILAMRGATDRQLMAIYNWSSEKEATRYTRRADRRRMAQAGMPLLNRVPKNGSLTPKCPTGQL